MMRLSTFFTTLIFSLTLLSAQEESPNWKFTPSIAFEGLLKSKFEYAHQTNTSRFSIRNSRFAISGDLTPFVSYRAQVELSNNGNFSVLDLYGSINPLEGFVVELGQTGIPIHNSYVTNPGKMMFANRAFIGKYFTPGTRDIGVAASYDFKVKDFPIGLDAAMFNGHKINDPVWTSTHSYAVRIRFGGMDGFRTTAKLYKYPIDEEDNFMFYGIDLRYQANNWKIETEFMQRENKAHNDKLMSAYLQGAYWFPLQNGKLFKNIITAARWDAMGSNQTTADIDVNRLTLGVGLSLTPSPFESLIRVDYEFYFNDNDLPLFNDYKEMSADKLSLELLLTF